MNEWLKELANLRRMNWVLTIAVGILLAVGVAFIYSASLSEESPSTVWPLYAKQIVWTIAGVACYLAFAAYDYRKLVKFAPWFYAGALILLVLVLFVGITMYGARRWLRVYGELRIQPSELAKLCMMLVLAQLMSRPEADMAQWKRLGGLLAVVAVPFALILKEPDLGTSMTLLPTAAVMMFVGGVPLRYLLTLAAGGLSVVLLILGVMFVPMKMGIGEERQEQVMRLAGLRPYHRDRIESFMRPQSDPLGAGWNKAQSQIAIGSGGKWGKGFLKGTQNTLGYLPVGHTDFIYSVIAEETGFAGSITILVVYGVILGCGIYGAMAAQDKMGCLLCSGVTTLLFSHVFINIAMTIGLLPITGLPLPFLSYGGTFVLITMSGVGVMQSVHIRSRRPRVLDMV